MRQRPAFQPAVDPLEARLTLSNMALHPMALPAVHVASHQVGHHHTGQHAISGHLAGSVRHLSTPPDVGQQYALSGSGRVQTLGRVRAAGTVQSTGFIQNGQSTGTLTLRNAKGSITLDLTGPPQPGFSPLPNNYHFVITGGTGAYKSSSGNGALFASWHPSASNPHRFDFTLQSA